jgi:hypothetical protein
LRKSILKAQVAVLVDAPSVNLCPAEAVAVTVSVAVRPPAGIDDRAG